MFDNLFLVIGLCIGILLMAYPVEKFLSTRRLQKRLVRISIHSVYAKVIPVQRISKFTNFTEFAFAINYTYWYDGKKYIGNLVFIEGAFSSDNEKIIQNLANPYAAVKFGYCDSKNPQNAFIEPDISPALKSHCKGLFGSGIVILIVSLLLFL